jgi:hypothetical protein
LSFEAYYERIKESANLDIQYNFKIDMIKHLWALKGNNHLRKKEVFICGQLSPCLLEVLLFVRIVLSMMLVVVMSMIWAGGFEMGGLGSWATSHLQSLHGVLTSFTT